MICRLSFGDFELCCFSSMFTPFQTQRLNQRCELCTFSLDRESVNNLQRLQHAPPFRQNLQLRCLNKNTPVQRHTHTPHTKSHSFLNKVVHSSILVWQHLTLRRLSVHQHLVLQHRLNKLIISSLMLAIQWHTNTLLRRCTSR